MSESDGIVAWFHCFAGISGDMALGSLLDAGADLDEVISIVRRIPLTGWRLSAETTLRGGISATRAIVTTTDSDIVVRTHSHIRAMLAEAKLPERVYRRSVGVFEKLARVEGDLHRRSSEQVHFHEVGGHDAVVDIVGTIAALEVLDVAHVETSAIATGMGVTRSAHGLLPNPSPAVVRLLQGLPTYGRNTHVELTTPTGAALISTLSRKSGAMPALTITGSGFGAGSHDIDGISNCTQVVIGEILGGGEVADAPGGELSILETNVDDVTGEQLAYAVGKLLEAGALDAWISPVVMKKGRPGHVVHVLCERDGVAPLSDVIFRLTGSLGVRSYRVHRRSVPRRSKSVTVNKETVRMKVTPLRAKPEFDDVAKLADALDVSPAEASSLVEERWRFIRGERLDHDSGEPSDDDTA